MRQPAYPATADELEFKPNLAACVERMRRFWNLEEPLDRVPAMVSVAPESPEDAGLDGHFFGRLDDYLSARERTFRRQASVPDETIPVVYPQFGHALVGALLGMPLRAESDTVWVEPALADLHQGRQRRLDWSNEWGRRFLGDLERLREWAEGRCALANYEVEGVVDTMAALRGATRVLLDAAERPDDLRAFAESVTDRLIEFGRWSCREIGAVQPLLGGETTGWRVWMPPDAMCFAEDATVMCSPAFYRAHFRVHDERLSAAFGAAILEVHHEGNHQLAEFGEVAGASLLTIESLRRMSGAHREVLRRLLGRKRFLFFIRPDEIEETLAFTGTRGVMLATSAPDVRAAQGILDRLLRVTEKATRTAGR